MGAGGHQYTRCGKKTETMAVITVSFYVEISVIVVFIPLRPPGITDLPLKDLPQNLPRDLMPIKYDITLHPNLTSSTFKGSIEMHLRVINPTDMVIFHAKNLAVTISDTAVTSYRDTPTRDVGLSLPEAVGRELSDPFTVAGYNQSIGPELVYIKLSRKLPLGCVALVKLRYSGVINERAKGLFKVRYNAGDASRTVLLSRMYNGSARQVFPCLDEPNLQAQVLMKIVRERHLVSLSNTALERSEPSHSQCENCYTDVFALTPPLSMNFVAVSVGNFHQTRYTMDSHLLQINTPMDSSAAVGYNVSDIITSVRASVSEMTNLFGVPFPLKKIDVVLLDAPDLPRSYGWGLIFMRPSSNVKQLDKEDIAQQVPMKSFGEASLWEGMKQLYPVPRPEFRTSSWWYNIYQKVFEEEDTEMALPLSDFYTAPKHRVKEIKNKAMALIAMLQLFFGEEKFLEAIQQLDSGGSVGNEEFVDTLTEVTGFHAVPLKDAVFSWIETAGYPLVTVTRSRSSVHLSQTRYLKPTTARYFQCANNKMHVFAMNRIRTQKESSWFIPVTYTTATEPGNTSTIWIDPRHPRSATFDLPHQVWIKANLNRSSLFVVNYDRNSWLLLATALFYNHTLFSTNDRRSLLDDAMTMARSGRLDYRMVGDIHKFLAKEKNDLVWQTFFNQMNFIVRRMDTEEEYRLVVAYCYRLLIYKTGHINRDRLELNNAASLRSDAEKLDSAIRIQDTVALRKIAKSEHPEVRWRLLVSCLLQQGPAPCHKSVIRNVGSNMVGSLITWQFTRTNWNTLTARYRLNSPVFAGLFRALENLEEFIDYEELERFFCGKRLGASGHVYKKTIYQIRENIYWRAKRMGEVKQLVRESMEYWAIRKESLYPFSL
ncbi:hypothetical protein RRG08_038835 [Elysia crispata]|uniref:Aminopeptidase n=1 Tax=Elysia crispata TaxID=231223 RepID=A0AAE1D4M2_9GAST|nr:hypothetical protein RRG08_038835 [Elysia crispata]